MQENPRYSLNEIRLLLAQYLDGALDADQLVTVELLLDSHPQAQAELLKIQETRGLLQHSLHPEKELKFSRVSDNTWKNIAKQLESDGQSEPANYDFEFISAYYDGELDNEACQEFESQLLQNDDANQKLANVNAISEMLRQFGYRQEEACTLDLTKQVMQAYQAESEATQSEFEEAVSPQIEMLSAFVDEELPAKEIIALNRLLEQNPVERKRLAHFHQLSDAIQSVVEQLLFRAPNNFWPQIKPQVQDDTQKQRGKVLPFGKQQSNASSIFQKFAIPMAAAAVLVLLSIPSLRENSFMPETSNSPASRYNHVQLASVPMNVPHADFMQISNPRYAQDRSSAQPLEPVISPNRKLASKGHQGVSTDSAIPSSEEYLFHALEEQMPDADVSSILGK